MKLLISLCLIAFVGWIFSTTHRLQAPSSQPCTPAWIHELEQNYIHTSDAQGHCPDPGSSEWLSVIEQTIQLPIRNEMPQAQRYQLIQAQLENRTFIINRTLGWIVPL